MVASIVGLAAGVSGHDPLASVSTLDPSVARADGLGILASILGAYTVVAVLLVRPRAAA